MAISMTRRNLLAAAILAGMAAALWSALPHGPATAATPAGGTAVRVDTARVARADVPIYLLGLGTVQAYNTVTVTARVDGQLQRIGFTEGQTVHKGDLLAQIDPRPARAVYEQAVAGKAKDAAQLANARRDLERYTLLEPRNLASKQTLDAGRATVDQLTAQLAVDQAVIDAAKTQLDYTRITSPIQGRTGIRLVDAGNIVHAADTAGIVVVTQLQPIAVLITLPQEDLPAVGQALATGPVTVITTPRGGGDSRDEGRLALIDNQIAAGSGTLKLKAIFDNARSTLWPGQFVDARVLVRIDHGALTIPSAAVQLGPDGPFTYVVKADSTVEMRPLKVGEDSDGRTIVRAGLESDERVVTSNQYRLQPGAAVSVASATHPDATS